jgi:hypothetical protein
LRPPTAVTIAALALVLGSGCAGAPPEQTGFMESLGVEGSRRELQILMYEFGGYFSGQVELAADRIGEETDDPDVRRAALEWKINATPAMLKSCFSNDPSMGLLGAWVFALQQEEYYESGSGKDVFGAQQPIAIETSRSLTERVHRLLETVWEPDQIEVMTPRVEAVAAEFPIRNQLFVREGFTPELAAEISGDVTGGMGVAGAMHEQMLAMNDRANVMTAVMPRQVRWQSELLFAEADQMVAARIDSAFTDVEPFLEYLSNERRALAADVSRERAAVLEGISAERLAVLEALADERQQVLTTLVQERQAAFEALNALTLASMEQAMAESHTLADDAIDRVALRVAQIIVIPLAVALGLAVAALLLMRSAIQRIPVRPDRDAGAGQ